MGSGDWSPGGVLGAPNVSLFTKKRRLNSRQGRRFQPRLSDLTRRKPQENGDMRQSAYHHPIETAAARRSGGAPELCGGFAVCGRNGLGGDNPSELASLPDYAFFDRFAMGDVRGLAPKTLPGALPQTPQGAYVRETRIIVPQAALLAISDAPPACFAHWARQAPVPLTLPRFAAA